MKKNKKVIVAIFLQKNWDIETELVNTMELLMNFGPRSVKKAGTVAGLKLTVAICF